MSLGAHGLDRILDRRIGAVSAYFAGQHRMHAFDALVQARGAHYPETRLLQVRCARVHWHLYLQFIKATEGRCAMAASAERLAS